MFNNLYYQGQTSEEALLETRDYLVSLLLSAQPMLNQDLQFTDNTTLKNVRIDSFQFVIDKVIEIIDLELEQELKLKKKNNDLELSIKQQEQLYYNKQMIDSFKNKK